MGMQNPQDKIVPLRGNIQTRLKKLQEEDWDGAIFAEAALHRLEIKEEIIEPLDQLLPAPAGCSSVSVSFRRRRYRTATHLTQ